MDDRAQAGQRRCAADHFLPPRRHLRAPLCQGPDDYGQQRLQQLAHGGCLARQVDGSANLANPTEVDVAGEIDRAVTSFARPLARCFQGTRAGDLPIEMPNHFELAINFHDHNGARPGCAAHAPLARADEVIE
jgi:hypothetical protein